MDREEYLKRVKSHIKTPTKEMEEQLEDFCKMCTYVSGQYDQDESFVELRKTLEELEKGRPEQNRVFYMALPPSVFTTVSQHLKKNCYPKNGISRIIVSYLPLQADRGGRITLMYSAVLGREAVWKGPRQLSRATESARAKLEGRGDFPHRPLPWKRNGQKYPHPPLWK